MRSLKKILAFILAFSLLAIPAFGVSAMAAGSKGDSDAEDSNTPAAGSSQKQMSEADPSEEDGDLATGQSQDISVSGVSVTGGRAGEAVTVTFTVTGNTNNKKKYMVDAIEKIYPVLDESFPFETNDAAYKVINGNGTSVRCSYTFKAKDNIETAYYPVNFMAVYSRKNLAGATSDYSKTEYSIVKSINVKLLAKAAATTTETAAENGDIRLVVAKTPTGTYGNYCSMNFQVKSSRYQLVDVTPVIGDKFPFETKGDAYRTIKAGGKKQVNCKFNFKVRSDVATGYQPVTFNITYIKNKMKFTTTASVDVKLTGKKEKKDKTPSDKKVTTPRVMVTGYDTDVKQVMPNSRFNLTLHIKNNAKTAVSNVKFTLATASGEFLPVSGASTAFRDHIAAGENITLTFAMKASAVLGAQSYPISVKAEYEDAKANPFSADDSITIPVTLKDRITITDLTPPDGLMVDDSQDLSFSINNLGKAALSNVTVTCKGKDFTAEDNFVGNIAAGATGYATVSLQGKKVTEGDGACTIKIKYENASGESKTFTQKTNVIVSDAGAGEDTSDIDESAIPEKKSGVPAGIIIAVVVIVIIVVIIIVRKHKKKKKLKEEEELMDDEL